MGTFESLSMEDRKLVRRIMTKLRQAEAPLKVFKAVGECAPIEGGLIGSLHPENFSATVSHVVYLPDDVLEGWASTPQAQLSMMLSPLLHARPGQLISDQAIQSPHREQIELLHRMRDVGLGEAAGYRVSEAAANGRQDLLFLTFALAAGELFTPRHHALLAVLRDDIHASLMRLRVPLLPSEPIHAQICEDRHIGFIFMKRGGQCVELNQRARELVSSYHPPARAGDTSSISAFAQSIIQSQPLGERRILQHVSRERRLEISTHAFPKGTHSLGEDLWLVMMEETMTPRLSDVLKAAGLTPRQIEIALMLVETGLSYKQMADQLGIEEGTLRKHVENIYRHMGVHSRSELVEKLRPH